MVFDTLESVGGYWSPLVWIIAVIVAGLVAYILWGLGSKQQQGGEQGTPFLSGHPGPSKEEAHVRADNMYWGFTEALQGYYTAMKRIHTGVINDYVLWFIGMAALFFILIIVPEVIL
ncbi:MAG: hydrogenase [Thermoplasmatota archaeon]